MINGILNIYKEPGITSAGVVARVRKIVGQKKVGHTGTLDPDAEGVLPICLGKATRIANYLTNERKTYRAELILGIRTDTQDISGRILEQKDPSGITRGDFQKVMEGFIGEKMQVPPMVSALKVGGKRLYELAREGRIVERKPRPVTFYSIDLIQWDFPKAEILVRCSRGTYIRTLIDDMGQVLQKGACMTHLVRTGVGPFHLEEAIRLAGLVESVEKGDIGSILYAADDFFSELKAYRCRTPEEDKIAQNGNFLFVHHREKRLRIYDSAGRFIGIYKRQDEKDSYRPEVMFYDPETGNIET